MDVTEALEKLEQAKSYWSEIYDAFRDDVRFSIGLDHWSDSEIKARGRDGCMIVPVLPQFIHQVVNDMRQNTPSINVLPGEGKESDPETAKIFKGLIRNIEYKSNSDEVYDTAGEYAVRGGFGFIRVDHDYVDDSSLLQELKLRRVQNPRSIYLDPRSTECDGSDAEWGIVLDSITKEEFDKNYSGKEFKSFDGNPTDSKAEEIIIGEIFIKEYEESTKQVSKEGNLEDYVDDGKEKKKRKIRKVKIGRYKFSGADQLEKTTFPGKYIPIALCCGEEVWDDGKRNLLSLIRLAKDAQRRVNKWASKESQILDMAPIAPVVAPFGAIEDFKAEWESPDDTMVMRYKMTDANGNKLDKPERLNPPPIPTGIINAMQGAKENVKEALGMYNASIGQKSNAISGVAYDAQKTEADVATFHFADNRNRAIQYVGRILVCAAPEIYDTERVIQIVGEEEAPQLIGINGAQRQLGQEQDHDLTKGQYDVRVTTGASYTTKRQETAALVGDIMMKQPELMGVIGDLYFKNLDVAGAEAIAARIKKTIPKELTADEDAKSKGEQAPDQEKIQMANVIQQLQAQMQQMAVELESKQVENETKVAETKIKQEEVDIKRGELKLKFLEAAKETGETNEAVGSGPKNIQSDDPVEVLQARVQQKLMSKQQAETDAQIQAEQQQAQEQQKAAMEAEELRLQQLDIQLRAEQGQALIGVLGEISNKVGMLTAQADKPIMVIRDPNTGAVIGAN